MHDVLCLNAHDVEAWMVATRNGWDEPLKEMLMALLPKLDRVNFIAYDPWQDDTHYDSHPLHFFCLAIKQIASTPGALWPPGFRTLRQVSVCTGTSLRHPHDAYYASPAAVAPFFLLPSIKVLNLTLLGYQDDEERADLSLPSGCLSVEELAFSCCEIAFAKTATFIRASRALRSLNVDSSGDEANGILKLCSEDYSDTLEVLRLNFGAGDNLDGRHLKSLRRLNVLQSLPLSQVVSVQPDGAVRLDLQDSLPPSIESVKLGTDAIVHNGSNVHKLILEAVADLAEDPRYNALNEFCLYDLMSAPRYGVLSEQEYNGFNWDEELFKRVRHCGVDLHRFGSKAEQMKYEDDARHHHDFFNGSLTKTETDPRPMEERW